MNIGGGEGARVASLPVSSRVGLYEMNTTNTWNTIAAVAYFRSHYALEKAFPADADESKHGAMQR